MTEEKVKLASTCQGCGHVGVIMLHTGIFVEHHIVNEPFRILLETHVRCPVCESTWIVQAVGIQTVNLSFEVNSKFAVWDAEMLLGGQ